MPVPYSICKHLHHSLSGAPAVLLTLLGKVPGDSGLWDLQPDPDRFTPRECANYFAAAGYEPT